MTSMKRRTLLKGTFASGVIVTAASAGLLKPVEVLAAAWPKSAFAGKSIDTALKSLYGGNSVTKSKAIKIKAPIQAENGAVVPIAVSTSLPDPESLSIFVNVNARPLTANIVLSKAAGFFSGRIKMAKTSDVQVVVKSGGKLHSASAKIKVTVGGCGG